MDKVICDICGTSYPETARQCPICGYSRGVDEFLPESQTAGNPAPARKSVKGGRFSQANVRKRTGGTHPSGADREEPEETEEKRRTNGLVVFLLVVLILAMLTVTAFLFIRFFLPNIGGEETQPSTSEETTEPSTGETSEETTEDPTIPCESLTLLSEEEVTLEGIGQYYLIHVEFAPLDTTDELVYASGDETVVVVDKEGRLETRGEGFATVTVTCGTQQVSVLVVCVPEQPQETTDETEETTEEPTEETTQAPTLLDIKLYLDKSDFTLSFRGDFYQLNFNPELSAEDITWESANSAVATVVNGRVTCVSYGTTRITARYGDQEVECIVRCVW